MTKSPDILIPKHRPPVDNLIPIRRKDADSEHLLVKFIEGDPRWTLLKESQFPSLAIHVLDTAMEIHFMTRNDVTDTADKLDAEISYSPYLNDLAKKRGTLSEQHEEMVKIFSSQLDVDIDVADKDDGDDHQRQYESVPYRLTQIHLAERLLGRQIEAAGEIPWIPERGFANPLAQVAIDLCIAAIRDVTPPDIY